MGVRERRRLRKRLAGLAALLPLLTAGAANADPLDVRGFGVFMGYAWGKENGFEWGFESIGTHHFERLPSCSSVARSGIGPVLRVAMIGSSRLAVTAALHGGGESSRSVLAFDGELGATLAFGERGLQGGIHTGLMFETIVFNAYAHQTWLMSTYSMGGGIRYLPTFGDVGQCVDGRAFRDAAGRPHHASLSKEPSDAARSAKARRWARRAAEECASVPAFLQLAHELLALDAPLELVARALDAAEEELGHTLAASELASRFAEARIVATAPRFEPRALLPRPAALQRLARESWLDGCLNEGLAAELAAAEADDASEPAERAVCARIAREEAGHATLAFDILRWLRGEARSLPWAQLGARTVAPLPQDSGLSRSTLRDISHTHAQRSHARFTELLSGV